ncbi:MAG: hypothetical protein KKH98_01210, partial [Spirochaetes bacterium]|nr:hypothetical protein [Spirochaetota bacterium]
KKLAENILKFMSKHQDKDGFFPSAYDADSGEILNPVPFSGHNGWVLMALNYYTIICKDRAFISSAKKCADYLLSMRDDEDKVIVGSPTVTWVSVEHQVDAYSGFIYLSELTGDIKYKKAADIIRKWVEEEMWILSEKQDGPQKKIPAFWTGQNDFGGISTDCQTWTVLSLGRKGLKGEKFDESLKWLLKSTCRTKADFGKIKNIDGFDWDGFEYSFDDKNTPEDESKKRSDTVWFEGTESAVCAYYYVGNIKMGDHFHGQTGRVMAANGGIPYSTPTFDLFGRSNFFLSVAATAWYRFNELKINPFRPVIRK